MQSRVRLWCLLLSVVLVFLAPAVQADPMKWQLGGDFDDGGTVTGLLVHDSGAPQGEPHYSKVWITTTTGTSLTGASYDDSEILLESPNLLLVDGLGQPDLTGHNILSFTLTLTNDGGDLSVPDEVQGIEGTCSDPVCSSWTSSRNLTSGQVAHRPNFVLIISDDASWAHYGFMDHTDVPKAQEDPYQYGTTPTLDDLAEKGIQFDIMHLTATMCRPSAAGIATGRYCREVETIEGKGKKLDHENQALIPKKLKDAGYHTLLAGKFTNIEHEVDDPYIHPTTGEETQDSLLMYGFTHIDDFGGHTHRGRKKITEDPQSVYNFIEAHKMENWDYDGDKGPNDTDHYCECHKDQPVPPPFLIWYFPHTPHRPWDAPQAYKDFHKNADDKKLQGYLPQITWLDAMIGGDEEFCQLPNAGCQQGDRLGGLLPTLGPDEPVPGEDLERTTMIFYLTDNGGMIPGSKGSFTEKGFRTPLVVSYPLAGWAPKRYSEVIPPPGSGAYDDQLVHVVDVLPTILDYARDDQGKRLNHLLKLCRRADPDEYPDYGGDSYRPGIACENDRDCCPDNAADCCPDPNLGCNNYQGICARLPGRSLRPLLEGTLGNDPNDPPPREYLHGLACNSLGKGGSSRYLRTTAWDNGGSRSAYWFTMNKRRKQTVYRYEVGDNETYDPVKLKGSSDLDPLPTGLWCQSLCAFWCGFEPPPVYDSCNAHCTELDCDP